MTVAALLFADSFPVAVTDALISTRRSPEAPNVVSITTPLRSNECRPGIDGFSPSGLALKQWMACPQTLLLYAGLIPDAERLLKYIQLKTLVVGYSDEIHVEVTDFIAANGLNVSFILVTRETDGEVGYYWHGGQAADSPFFGRIVSIGAGKTPLLDIFRQSPAAELPDPYANPLEHAEAVVVNALEAVAVLSRDYTDQHSKMAGKSTGGLFNVAYFPELFGAVSDGKLSTLALSGICQIWVELQGESAVITRMSVSGQSSAGERMDLLLFEGEQVTAPDSTYIEIAAAQLQCITIGRVRDESAINGYSPGPGFSVHQAIVYVERTERCPHGGRPRTHQVFACRGEPLVHIVQGEVGIALTLVQPIMAKLIRKVVSAAPCPMCADGSSPRAS